MRLQRLVGELHCQAKRAFHYGPLAHLERAQFIDHKRIRCGDCAGLLDVLGAQDGQAIAGGLARRARQRAGGEQDAFPLQADHVFEILRQQSGNPVGRRAALREDHVELLAQHARGELPNTLLSRRRHYSGPTLSAANPMRLV
jgi:hypothetical protein